MSVFWIFRFFKFSVSWPNHPKKPWPGLRVPRLGLTTSNPGMQGSRYLGLGTWAKVPRLELTPGLSVPGLKDLGLGT